MITINLGNGISITLPELNGDAQFKSFSSKESVGGELPTAVLRLKCDQDMIELLDELTIKIDNNEGFSFSANMYVYAISYLNNDYEIRLMSCNPEFTRSIKSTKFSSYKSAVSSLYPGEIITNTDTDLLNDLEIIQCVETDYKLLSRLMQAWKKNTIFGYALDGLRINDLGNFVSKFDDSSMKGNLKYTSIPVHTKPKLMEHDTEFHNYSDGLDPNHLYVKSYNTFLPVDAVYKDLFSNYLYNQKFVSNSNIYNASTSVLYPMNITDGVNIGNNDVSIEETYIYSRNILIENNQVKVDYTFKSIK